MGKIPIVIGVTGHRDPVKEALPDLENAVRKELVSLKKKYPNSPVVMLNSIAAGADILCAKIALELEIPIYCPLPMDKDEYIKDFSEDSAREFESISARAEEVFTVPEAEPRRDGRDFLYRQAGIYVASHSHVLLALWDGEKGESTCGTAASVDFMLRENYGSGRLFRAENYGAVIAVATPRESKGAHFPVTVKLIENEKGSLDEVLRQTDLFNRDCGKIRTNKTFSLLPEENLHGKT